MAHMDSLRTKLTRNRLRYSSGDELAASENAEFGGSAKRGCCAGEEEGRWVRGGNAVAGEEEWEDGLREQKRGGAE